MQPERAALLQEAQRQAQDAERALSEHLRPAFERVEAVYTERLKQVAVAEPWAADKLRNLALALKISEAARLQIEELVAGGNVAESEMTRIAKIEKMSPERRRILGL